MMLRTTFLTLICSLSLAAAEEFSADSAHAHMVYLTQQVGPRTMGSPAEQRALAYARDRFHAYGCDTSYIMPFTQTSGQNTTSGIAVGILYGDQSEAICIGAHIDTEGPEIEGANDNASGCAVVLELARILVPTRHRSTLVFCCFGGEERGLEGSKFFTGNFERIDDVNMMIQVDMADGSGTFDIDPHSYGSSAPSWLVRAAFEEASRLDISGLIYPTNAYILNYLAPVGASSDHASFLEKGIPAVSFTSELNYPIHTPQDILEIFTPSGLGRSGTLAAALVRRFDAGVPGRMMERYLLFVFGTQPIFLTPAMVITFLVLAMAMGIIALLSVRRRRVVSLPGDRIRWSTLKTLLFATIVLTFAWGSPDIVGLIKGLRLPWYADPEPFWWLAAGFGLIGIWVAARLEERLPLTACPYLLFKRAFIMLSLGIFILLSVGVGPAFYPAMALFLFSLAVIIHSTPVRILLMMTAVYFSGKLIFSSWGEFWFRTIGLSLASARNELQLVAATVFLFGVFLAIGLPPVFGILAVSNDTRELKNRGSLLRSTPFLIAALILSGGLTVWTSRIPSYTTTWNTRVTATDHLNLANGVREIVLRSPEYLDGIRIIGSGTDTTITSKQSMINLPVKETFEMGLLTVERKTTDVERDTLATDLVLTLRSLERPLSVRVTYSGSGKSGMRIETLLKYREEEDGIVLEWYSFPDSVLDIPLRLHHPEGVSISEKIEVTYARLAQPMVFERALTSFRPRTVVTDAHIYAP